MRYGAWLLLGVIGCAAAPVPEPVSSASEADDLGEDHPLVGTIYDARRGELITADQAREQVRQARFLLLGEKHDNPAHHAGQAVMLAERAEAGEPVLVWEMIHRQQSFAGPVYEGDASAFAAELQWDRSGWPAFEIYRPIAEVAIGKGLAQFAGNLEPLAMRTAYKEGLEGLVSERARALGVRRTLEGSALQDLRDNISRGHCGYGDDAMLDSMAAAQQSRDAFMAKQLVENERDGAVLVAGGGHVRRDRAVPFHLEGFEGVSRDDILVLTWAEVRVGVDDPSEYAGTPATFDLVFFTPRMSNEDPCDRFEEQVERIRAQERKRSTD